MSALVGAQALLGLGALWAMTAMAMRPHVWSPVGVAVFTLVLIAMGRLTPLYVEFHRHASWVAPTDGAYMVGLVALGPLGLVLAVGLAELATSTWSNRALVKRVFNVVSITAGAAVGALGYASAGGSAQPLQLPVPEEGSDSGFTCADSSPPHSTAGSASMRAHGAELGSPSPSRSATPRRGSTGTRWQAVSSGWA